MDNWTKRLEMLYIYRILLIAAVGISLMFIHAACEISSSGTKSANAVSIPDDSITAQILGSSFIVFDRQYPAEWPKGLYLPDDAYLNNDGSIFLVGDNETPNKLGANGIVKGERDDVFNEIISKCRLDTSNAQSGLSNNFRFMQIQLNNTHYDSVLIRVDRLECKTGWSRFFIHVSR